MKFRFSILLFALSCASISSAGTITIGVAITTANQFPFIGTGPAAPGTRYQQAFGASDFSEAMLITDLSFFRQSAGNFRSATYDLYLSTISSGINTLSTANFASNLGGDNTLFATMNLAGSLPAVLTFTGGPFFYDPLDGNLLLDVVVSNAGASGFGGFQWQSGASGVFSRYYDFFAPPTKSFGSGLVTRFDYTPVPEPETAYLLGLPLALLIWKRRRYFAAGSVD